MNMLSARARPSRRRRAGGGADGLRRRTSMAPKASGDARFRHARKKLIIEFFCGQHAVSTVFEQRGWQAVTGASTALTACCPHAQSADATAPLRCPPAHRSLRHACVGQWTSKIASRPTFAVISAVSARTRSESCTVARTSCGFHLRAQSSRE